MKVAESDDIKKIKHREVERVRHHKLQKLINNLSQQVPDDKSLQNTQCAILKKTFDYIEFLISEYDRIASNIEVESYSSSQGTVSSSQGPLIIDESYQETEQITCDVDPDYGVEDETKFPPLPSSLLSPEQEYFDFTPPISYSSSRYNDEYRFDQSPFPSPPPTSPPSLFSQLPPPPPLPPATSTFQYMDPQTEQKNIYHQPFAHCRSCCCFSSSNFNTTDRNDYHFKSFAPRDHLLTETIQDPYITEPDLSPWA